MLAKNEMKAKQKCVDNPRHLITSKKLGFCVQLGLCSRQNKNFRKYATQLHIIKNDIFELKNVGSANVGWELTIGQS